MLHVIREHHRVTVIYRGKEGEQNKTEGTEEGTPGHGLKNAREKMVAFKVKMVSEKGEGWVRARERERGSYQGRKRKRRKVAKLGM